MRLLHALLLIPLFAVPALAETTAPPAAQHQARRTAEQHFADANTSHDGKLTLEQAMSGYKTIAKSFAQIDANHHGYVTLDDIKAWKEAKKAARHAAKQAAAGQNGGILRPSPAVQHGDGPRAMGTSTDMVVPSQPRVGVDLPNAPLEERHSS
jgi:hypothetical protein